KNSQGSAEPAVFDIIKIVPPKDPEAISCADNVYPNYAICRLDGYDDGKRGEWPTRFFVYYTNEEQAEEFDWVNSATAYEVLFHDGKTIQLDQLDTEQKYFALIDCPDVCSVNWTTPNDRGAEITGYKLVFRETSPIQSEVEESTSTEVIEASTENGENSSEEGDETVDDSIEEDNDEDNDIREQIT
uniref:Uncharacterized protein n=1 Tax=Panagrolaimus sp. PS1159 TaxID=55785 RepID=A0AC35FM43_9BILA